MVWLHHGGEQLYIYEGRDVDVRFSSGESNHNVVVTFTHLNSYAENPKEGFGEKFLIKNGVPAVHFIAKWNHWWQTPEMSDAVEAVRQSGLLHGRARIGYGSSMGAYGAILYSGRLGLDRVLALTPQFSIRREIIPTDHRWSEYEKAINFIDDDIPACASRVCDLLVVYDPLFNYDAVQANQILSSLPNARSIRMPFAGHPVTPSLRKAGMLKDLVLSVIDGRGAPDDFHVRRRKSRGDDPNYLRWLASSLLNSKRYAHAQRAAELCVALDDKSPQAWKILAVSASFCGHKDKALSASDKALQLLPDSAEMKRLYVGLRRDT